MKAAALVIVLALAVTTIQATWVFHDHKKAAAKVGAGQNIGVFRCRNPNCTACTEVVEFKGGQCHDAGIVHKHGEIFHCAAAPKKSCFRETLHNSGDNAQCSGNVIASAPRECDVCVEGFAGEYFKYTGCGTKDFAVSRGCDFGCGNCQATIPLQEEKCVENFPLPNMALWISKPTKCGADITAEAFFDPLCDGTPLFKNTVFTDECYSLNGYGHKFTCK